MSQPLPAADRDTILALLDFHVAAGVDLALDEEPHDRFADSARPAEPAHRASVPAALPADAPRMPAAPPPHRTEQPTRLPAAAAAPTGEVAIDARRQAAAARDLGELERMLTAFEGCALKATARQLAFSDGKPGSRVMILGEAPGAEEDRTGKPFVGRAGQLLDRMLASIGLDRTEVYIANVVPWRPPGNRTPTPQEIAICLPFTERQIELARPEILVTTGSPATQTILASKDGITKMRGRWGSYRAGAIEVRVLPMLHPAYLLRQPLHKRLAWRDLQMLRIALAAPDTR